jgi:hypothetical protein
MSSSTVGTGEWGLSSRGSLDADRNGDAVRTMMCGPCHASSVRLLAMRDWARVIDLLLSSPLMAHSGRTGRTMHEHDVKLSKSIPGICYCWVWPKCSHDPLHYIWSGDSPGGMPA